MSIVQFGTASVHADIDPSNRAILDIVYSTGLSQSTRKAVFKGYPLTLYTAANSAYSLAVIVDNAFSLAAKPPSLSWRSQVWALANTGIKQCFGVRPQLSENATVAATGMFRGMPLALNSNKSLILTAVTGTVDQEERAFLGTNTITLRRIGTNWHLVVAEV